MPVFVAIIIGIMIATDDSADAHPGHAHGVSADFEKMKPRQDRRWCFNDLEKSVLGSFVMERNGLVQVRRQDDTLIEIPWDNLSDNDQAFVEERIARIRAESMGPLLVAQLQRARKMPGEQPPPMIATHFDPFVKLKAIRTRWDDKFFFVESNGIPAHQMMVGITSWQQQVPIPQKYVGDNAWQIPLNPVEAKNPVTAKGRFLRGAIALAVNGIPIFNPLNNRGDDAFLFGELDEFGGHCGRADDYHYHLAPVHLEKIVGKGNPIAYALDGYPIYGEQDPKDADFAPLDALNGHKDAQGRYHYHATKTYPYLNGGFHGVVIERDGQVDPQPRAEPLRPALSPLRNARITGFEEIEPGRYRLTYEVNGQKGTVSYQLADNGSATFEFMEPNGRTTKQTFSPQRRGPVRGENPPPPPRPDNNSSPPGDRPKRKTDRPQDQTTVENESGADKGKLEISSTSIDSAGRLSVDCTCDGKRESPAVSWKRVPADARYFAISLWHQAPDQEKSYWLVYNIPASVTGVGQNEKPEGTVGLNDRRRAEFDPMCSKGPGLKTYHMTVYALSQKIAVPQEKATRAGLLEAIKKCVVAERTLSFQYERKSR